MGTSQYMKALDIEYADLIHLTLELGQYVSGDVGVFEIAASWGMSMIFRVDQQYRL